MNPFLLYFIKSFLSLGIFYITWLLFFRKQIDFRFNRYYLILATLLAVLVPLIHLPELFPTGFRNPIGQLSVVQIREVLVGSTGSHAAAGDGWPLATVLWGIYLLGMIVMTVRFLLSLRQLYRLARKSETKTDAGIKFIFTTGRLPVFSFFHLIFISKEMFENPHAAVIISHEKIHIEEKHSLDLLILEILCIFQWFNPFVYLIKKAVKENHEFIADRSMPASESNSSSYLRLLFREASGFEFNPITHNFNYSLLKKRIIMMKNQKSQKRMPVKLLLSALALSLTLFACSNSSQPVSEKTSKNLKGTTLVKANLSQTDTGQIFKVVEKMPEYPGGVNALISYLSKNIHYPEQARKAKVQGRVFINFIVEKDGSISHVKVLKGIGYGFDKEAVKAVKNMPRWIPGYQKGKPVRVSYNLPVKFTLQ
ncbi:MAG: cell envelope biogenesis protein TonB [bacterium]|nr:MAG: cell envelope biogenesis protein TonB [bacterium]